MRAPAHLQIITAGLRHMGEIVPLFLAYCEFYQLPAPVPKVRRFLRARLQRRDSRIFLARLNGVPVGFAQLYPTFASLAQRRAWVLYDLYVSHEARRQGVATALLQRTQRFGAETDAAELMLETARTNRPAQHLYERLGWRRDNLFHVYRYDYLRQK